MLLRQLLFLLRVEPSLALSTNMFALDWPFAAVWSAFHACSLTQWLAFRDFVQAEGFRLLIAFDFVQKVSVSFKGLHWVLKEG